MYDPFVLRVPVKGVFFWGSFKACYIGSSGGVILTIPRVLLGVRAWGLSLRNCRATWEAAQTKNPSNPKP